MTNRETNTHGEEWPPDEFLASTVWSYWLHLAGNDSDSDSYRRAVAAKGIDDPARQGQQPEGLAYEDAVKIVATKLRESALRILSHVGVDVKAPRNRIEYFVSDMPDPLLVTDTGRLAIDEALLCEFQTLVERSDPADRRDAESDHASWATDAHERAETGRQAARSVHKVLRPWLVDAGDKGWLRAPQAVLFLSSALWHFEVRHRVRNPPALVRTLHGEFARVFSSPRREEEATGQRALALGEPLLRLACVGVDAMQALRSERGMNLFGSVPAHRTVRYLVFEGHRRAFARDPDPRMLEYSSWLTFVRDCLHDHSKAAVEKYRNILWAMHSTDLVLPNGQTTRLLTLADRKDGRGPGRPFQIVLNAPLMPNYVHELQNITRGPRDKLIPWLPMPPFVGRERDHGAQANLQLHLLLALRDRADELVHYGGVALSEENLAKLARDSGLPLTLVPKVMDRWTQDGDDGPAVLKQTERGIYTLGDHYARERTFLEEGGRRELDGARNGRLGVAKRKQARERNRKKD